MGQGPDTEIDFGKLSAAERTALSLLAQGHTAKSIANLTDRSVGAVNERLREARRKTGVGSSRELARLFAAQENRDEFIGVAPVSAADPETFPPGAPRARLWKGAMLMSVIVAGVFAAVALVTQPQSQPTPTSPAPAAVLAVVEDTPSPRELHDRIAAEPRDPAWAPQTEAKLARWFASRPAIAGITGRVTVHCGSTMCEAFGSYPSDTPADRTNAALSEIQGKPFKDAITPLGLNGEHWSFASDSFAVFVSRAPAGT
jgi:DNA-binding CsgD family transcriptional regulator